MASNHFSAIVILFGVSLLNHESAQDLENDSVLRRLHLAPAGRLLRRLSRLTAQTLPSSCAGLVNIDMSWCEQEARPIIIRNLTSTPTLAQHIELDSAGGWSLAT